MSSMMPPRLTLDGLMGAMQSPRMDVPPDPMGGPGMGAGLEPNPADELFDAATDVPMDYSTANPVRGNNGEQYVQYAPPPFQEPMNGPMDGGMGGEMDQGMGGGEDMETKKQAFLEHAMKRNSASKAFQDEGFNENTAELKQSELLKKQMGV